MIKGTGIKTISIYFQTLDGCEVYCIEKVMKVEQLIWNCINSA